MAMATLRPDSLLQRVRMFGERFFHRFGMCVFFPPSRAPSKAPSQSPCLPPISSWLPNPYVDPSCLPSMPDPSAPSSHLPTPPLSGSFRVPLSLASQAPPALTLPGPAHPLPAESFASSSTSKAMRIALPTRRMSNAAAPSPSDVRARARSS